MSKNILFIVFALAIAACAVRAAQRPDISEVFETRLFIEVHERNGDRYSGRGIWATDQPKGESLVINYFERDSHLEMYHLQRFDLGKEFSLQGENRTCQVHSLSGAMPLSWAWVANSSYTGKVEMHGRASDVWRFSVGFAELELGVDTQNPNIPHFLRRNSSYSDVLHIFDSWNTSVSEGMFAIPNTCGARHERATLACRQRSDMLAVAQKWVKAKVPYNQGAHYDGYREDCSGYVSATWELPKPGAVTSQFHNYAHRITKAELKTGDILLYAAEHVVFFDKWTSSAETHYIAFEETNPKEGTVTRETPYPYWYSQSSFLPYRYNNAC